jgi:hypothetical protein
MCPTGNDNVWVGERSGLLTVRCARTGKVKHTVQPSANNFIFATCMTTSPHNELWVGTNDGRVCVFDTNTNDMIVELRSPETEKSGEIHCIGIEGRSALVGSASHRISQWGLVSKEFIRSFIHSASVSALTVKGGVCYAGDTDGHVIAWDVHSGERSGDYKSDTAISCVELEPTTSTLWCGGVDGRVVVLNLTPSLSLAEVMQHGPRGRLNSLLAVGGKMWGAGIERTTFIWHAQTRKLIGKTKDHSAFIFQLSKLYTMETSRIWSLSNDKTIQIYDGEGFFAPVTAHGGATEEITAAQAQAQSLKAQIGVLERRLALEEDKLTSRDVELEKLKDELHKALLKVHALEHVIEQKDDAIYGTKAERAKLFDDTAKLNAKIAELQGKVNGLEHEKTLLRGDAAKAEEALTRARTEVQEKASAALVAETERKAALQDNERTGGKLREKDAIIDRLNCDLKAARDEVVSKGLELQRRVKENDSMHARVRQLEQQVNDREAKYRTAEDARRRLDDQLIVRENEIKQLNAQLQNFAVVRNSQANELQNLSTAHDHQAKTAAHAHDNLLLKSHEFDVVRNDREKLERMLQHEKQQVQDARNNEQRLAMQNDELRRQIEKEKNTVRMLEDQYTIFQFVINSRGELINSIWALHAKVGVANKTLRGLDAGISQTDPTKDKMTLRREWKANVVDRSKVSYEVVADLQERVDYIIANYLSDYEKMHLGIPTAKFAPDASRPAIIGDALLTKLRDVTLVKQVPSETTEAKLRRLPPPSGSTLAPEHFASAPKPTTAASVLQHRPATASAALDHTRSSVTGHSVRPL